MLNRRNHIVWLLAAGTLCTGAFAQAPAEDDLANELLALLNAPVQGASKREQRIIDSPQGIEVLTGDEIRQMGIYRLVDALRLMTSVDVLELDNHVHNISLRGAMQQGQPRNVQILVDGVPFYNAQIAAVDIADLPVTMDLVDKIEVVRGPSSSLYGANAVVGVIAITTRRAGAGVGGAFRASTAGGGTSRGAASLALGDGTWGLTVGYQGASQRVQEYDTLRLDNGAAIAVDGNRGHQNQLFARTDFKSGQSNLWAAGGAARKWVATWHGEYTPYQIFETRSLSAGWGQAWTQGLRSEVRFSHSGHAYKFGPSAALANNFDDPGLLVENIWAKIASDQFELQVNWDPSATFHVVAGADHRKVTADPSSVIGYAETIKESASGGFLNIDWNLAPNVTLSAGARAENETLGGSRTSPRVVLMWNPSKNASVRAGYYSSSRSPQEVEARVNFTNTFSLDPMTLAFILGEAGLDPATPIQPYFHVVPNPKLQPEDVTCTELGYRQIVGTVSIDVTVFNMKFKGLIAQQEAPASLGLPPITPDPEIGGVDFNVYQQYVNTTGATSKGVEAAILWRPSTAWSYGGNATWLDSKMDGTDTTPSYAPKVKLNLWTRFHAGAFSGYLGFNHVGKVDMDVLSIAGTSSPLTKRDAINSVSGSLTWQSGPRCSVGVYAMNALKDFTEQGGGGPVRTQYIQKARREIGVTAGYRF